MASAQGQVQNLGYKATFPLLLNIAGEPTYFMALKDNAGLVKKYAMVNIQKYQWVAIGDTVAECEEAYISLLASNGISTEEVIPSKTIEGTLSNIVPCVIDGNTHYYLQLANNDAIFDLILADHVAMINYKIGDLIKLEYIEGTTVNTVTTLLS